MKNGKKITTAADWWNKRRPEIVEDFDREIYGRAPKDTPAVKWEITGTVRELNGAVPVVTKHLIGHVGDTINIGLTVSTPADAAAPVPVIMELAFQGFPKPAGITWQEQFSRRDGATRV